MNSHGTPFSCTNGQQGTITGHVATALPRAISLSGLNPATIIKCIEKNGDGLSKALGEAFRVLYGHARITVLEDIIDCDADPFVPKAHWTVEEHQGGGQFRWSASQVRLFLAKGQQNARWFTGDNLHKELAGKPVLNANVLDYLLANLHLIPEEWEGKEVFFWGTLYRCSEGEHLGNLYIRSLRQRDDMWIQDYRWLGRGFNNRDHALVRAS